MKRPSFQFYPGDWLRSADLRACSVGARGLWIDMICWMHDGATYGYLKVGTKIIPPSQLASMVGATKVQVDGWLKELVNNGVVSVTDDGCYYSRRMVRDEEIRVKRAAVGKLGGNPRLRKTKWKDNPEDNQEVNQMDNHEDNQVVNPEDNQVVEETSKKRVNQKLTPSSSSSSALSNTNTPLTPLSGGRSGVLPGLDPPDKPKRTAADVPIPESLDTPEFRAIWKSWLDDRKERRKPVTARAAEMQLQDCEKFGQEVAIEAIRRAIKGQWQGIFPEKVRAEYERGNSGTNWTGSNYRNAAGNVEQAGRVRTADILAQIDEERASVADLPVGSASG